MSDKIKKDAQRNEYKDENELRKMVENRRKMVEETKSGGGKMVVKQLGTRLDRLSIILAEPTDALKEVIDKAIAEKREAEAEKFEWEKNRVKRGAFLKKYAKKHFEEEIPLSDCIQMAQVEVQKIDGKDLNVRISKGTAGILEGLVRLVAPNRDGKEE
jgi:hypothetical protein